MGCWFESLVDPPNHPPLVFCQMFWKWMLTPQKTRSIDSFLLNKLPKRSQKGLEVGYGNKFNVSSYHSWTNYRDLSRGHLKWWLSKGIFPKNPHNSSLGIIWNYSDLPRYLGFSMKHETSGLSLPARVSAPRYISLCWRSKFWRWLATLHCIRGVNVGGKTFWSVNVWVKSDQNT